ncbi:MAG: RNA-binding protein [Methanosphaera stadtmanae]|jgi:exosome complex component CSL4|nr:RNA-binding protein [Methanosphaera stadtmanae]
MLISIMGSNIMNHKENEYVFPGEVLCTYEEYVSSEWTYVDDGFVKAGICGRIIIDDINKTISIESDNPPKSLKNDDLIIGHITEVKSTKALITIKKIVGTDRDLITGYKGYIHISKATNDYVQTLHYLFKIGDIVLARVANLYSADYVELSTSEDELGVIKAMCVNCRNFMKLNKQTGKLECECGKVDFRKISLNYGGIEE